MRARGLKEKDRSCWKVGREMEAWRRARGDVGGKKEGLRMERNSSRASDGRPDLSSSVSQGKIRLKIIDLRLPR